MNPQKNKHVQSSKNIMTITIIMVATALIVSYTLIYLQKNQIYTLRQEMQKLIIQNENIILQNKKISQDLEVAKKESTAQKLLCQTAAIINDTKLQSATSSLNLMREVLIKDNPDILSGRFLDPAYYKIFKEIKSPYSSKSAVLFGLDIQKTLECCLSPTGIFINNQGRLGANYEILHGALEHLYLDNVKWRDDNTVLYDYEIADEGNVPAVQKMIKVE